MLRTFLKRLLGKPPNPAPTGLVVAPANISVPENLTPSRVPLITIKHVLRRNHGGTLVLAGTTVHTKKNIQMRVASVEQKPPYVICNYNGRRLAVRPDTIDCHFAVVSEPIQ